MREMTFLSVLALAFLSQGKAGAQVILLRQVGDKTVACMHTGLSSDRKDCGARADWYSYVFVGLISKVTSLDNDEKEVEIAPEEVFLGAPSTSLKVVTLQGLCMRELKVGDKWLFYLRKGTPIVLDYYANDSVPLGDAKEQITTLRRLKDMGDLAILRGHVAQTGSLGSEVLLNASVMAIRQSTKEEFTCVTGPDGRYEFEPLSPDTYSVIVRPIESYQPDDSEIDLTGGTCTDLTLSRSPHALIAGHVNRSDGTPVPNVAVVLICADDSCYETTKTNGDGQFMFNSRKPGKYVVGLNYPGRSDWFDGGGAGIGVKIPPASLFYPGVPDRSSALVINLATDEKLDKLDFIIAIAKN